MVKLNKWYVLPEQTSADYPKILKEVCNQAKLLDYNYINVEDGIKSFKFNQETKFVKICNGFNPKYLDNKVIYIKSVSEIQGSPYGEDLRVSFPPNGKRDMFRFGKVCLSPSYGAYGTCNLHQAKLVFSNKKENEMKILELYYDKKKNELTKENNKQTELIYKNNEVTKLQESLNKNNKFRVEVYGDYLTDEEKEKLDKLRAQLDKEIETLCKQMDLLRALLSEAETYEQKQNIYKEFGILDYLKG